MNDVRGTHLSLLAEFHHSGDHEAGWRLPGGQPKRIADYDYYRDLAQVAERGLFDALFFADFHAFRPGFRDSMAWGLEPTSLLAAVAAECPEIGIVATASTVYSQAETLARTFATLYEQTQGRVAWNIVTAGQDLAAKSYGLEANPPHDQRYEQAGPFVVDVLNWWQRNPEGYGLGANDRPLLVQAGSSEQGREFAARYAELVFTATPDIESARAFRDDLRTRASSYGRSPDSVKISPGFLVVLGSTEAEAQRLRDDLDDRLTENHYRNMLHSFGFNIDDLDLDTPLNDRLSDIAELRAIRSRVPILERVVSLMEGPVTFRRLVRSIAGSRGHLNWTGTPEQVADVMEAWFRGGAADAFVIKFSHNPGGVQDFVDGVIPELQRRGLFRREYGDGDLRKRFGIGPNSMPASAAARAAA